MKIDYKIVIPSYDRPELIKKYTLNFLETSNLLEKSEIYIFTPQLEEYCESLKCYPINILPCPVGLINARNYIKDYFPEDSLLLILDDDVKGVSFNKDLHTEIIRSFKFMLSKGITLGSINPTGNSYFRTNEYKLGLYLCIGCFYMEINKKTNYLENYFFESEKEDYIRTLKHYQSDGVVFRNDYINVLHKMNRPGGMSDEDRLMNNTIACRYIKSNYPLYCFLKAKKSRELEIQLKRPSFTTFFVYELTFLIMKLKHQLKYMPIPMKDSREATAGKGRSIVFGLTRVRRQSGLQLSKYSKLYPGIWNDLIELGNKIKFPFTSVMINRNFQCNPHIDNNKDGTLNMIFGFGDYTGGNLNYNGKSIDIRDRFLIFDGSKEHYVEPFEGDRMTITFFYKK